MQESCSLVLERNGEIKNREIKQKSETECNGGVQYFLYVFLVWQVYVGSCLSVSGIAVAVYIHRE
jgi:hypothetical protein